MKSNNTFGLDIGATSMKAVWLDHTSKGFLLKSALSQPTPAKGMLSESPLDQEEMAQAIRKIVSDGHITTPHVNIALPENQVYTKVLDVPQLSDNELQSAIYWEAEQYIPVPLATITLDYTVLKKPEKTGEKMTVLLVGAPTSLIDKYEKVITMSGLYIETVETEILSAIRALMLTPNSPPTIIVNIGAISTSFAIIKSNIIVFTYSIPVGGTAINRAIASDLGFSVQQAEEYKKTYGLKDSSVGGKLGKATEPILATVISEIKKAVAFYEERYKNEESISQVLLSGGTAKLPGIDVYFARNTGVESAIANPWKMLADQEVPKDIIDNAVDYTVAAGLAVRGYDS